MKRLLLMLRLARWIWKWLRRWRSTTLTWVAPMVLRMQKLWKRG